MDNLKYSHILSFVTETPWAILPAKWAIISDLLALRMSGGELTDEEIQARIGAVVKPQQRQAGAIAVLPLFGTIIPRGNMMMESSGATSVERFAQSFRQAMADPAVSGVVIDTDSPGGSVQGVGELADEIYQARGIKPVLALANNLAASAAYWIGTAASEMMVTPSGEVGSIGVFCAHENISALMEKRGVQTTLISAGKYKVEGSPYGPLSEEAQAALQDRVNDYYLAFTDAVGRNRGVAASDVRSGFGEGRVVGARQAKRYGMVDGIGTIDDAIARMVKLMRQGGAKAEDMPFPLLAEAIEVIELDHEAVGQFDLRRRRLKLAHR